jgi:hypothetical protein
VRFSTLWAAATNGDDGGDDAGPWSTSGDGVLGTDMVLLTRGRTG